MLFEMVDMELCCRVVEVFAVLSFPTLSFATVPLLPLPFVQSFVSSVVFDFVCYSREMKQKNIKSIR